MNIQVNDFHWEPGKNDAEYIKLLESLRDEWQKLTQKAIAKLKAQEPVKHGRWVRVSGYVTRVATLYGNAQSVVREFTFTELKLQAIKKTFLTSSGYLALTAARK